MTIQTIYDQHQIMPNLRLHMYRVAGVAQQIWENLQPAVKQTVDEQAILSACLLHDMGNIIKFHLEKFPSFLEPEGLAYWCDIQQKCINKYGPEEHQAALQIAQELGVSKQVVNLIDAINFTKIQDDVESADFARKICEYADDRVTPFGVVSLAARIQDLEDRYHQKYPSPADHERRQKFGRLALELEQQIFRQCRVTPADITDQTVNTRLADLQKFEIIAS